MKEVSSSFLCEKSSIDLIHVLNNSHTDYIHFDVMDGNFVNNRFLTIKELKQTLSRSTKKNDIHLMVSNPIEYIKEISSYNISFITIHYEIDNLEECINLIKSYGIKVGVALKPETKIEKIYSLLDKIDVVLIMSVNPGASGQKFITNTKQKIDSLKHEIEKRKSHVLIEVDGGIEENVLQYIKNADIVVSASFILKDLKNIDIIKKEN